MKHQTRLSGRALGYRAVQVLALVRLTIEARGYAPSYGEICDELGFFDKTAVRNVVRRLEKRGLLMRVGRCRIRQQTQHRWYLEINVPPDSPKLEAKVPV